MTDVPTQRVADAVAQLDALSADVLERSGIPGMAVAVVHRGKTVYAKGFGHRRLGDPGLITSETVFQLASVSKSGGTAQSLSIELYKDTGQSTLSRL
ncbi:serine hydrolase [Pusillimonas sp.]|uniref:serine hydrolase n=1 Tax=Pusillimonas sp. TaxID=3040095 RepID=UPI0037C802EF